MEDTATLDLPADLATALGVSRLVVHYTALVGGAILHGATRDDGTALDVGPHRERIEALLARQSEGDYLAARHPFRVPTCGSVRHTAPKAVHYRGRR